MSHIDLMFGSAEIIAPDPPPSPRRRAAMDGAREVLRTLRTKGVTAFLTGSLADGSFDATSDIDFVVTKCPRHLVYNIESVVEDLLPGFTFDIVYAHEAPRWLQVSLFEKSRDLCAEG